MVLSDVPQAMHTSPSLILLYSENTRVAALSIQKTTISSESDDANAKASAQTSTPHTYIYQTRSLSDDYDTHMHAMRRAMMVTTERHIAAYMRG